MSADEHLAVWFTPDCIRDAFDGVDADDPRKVWVENASEEALLAIGKEIIFSDSLWSLFHELIEQSVDERLYSIRV